MVHLAICGKAIVYALVYSHIAVGHQEPGTAVRVTSHEMEITARDKCFHSDAKVDG